MRSGVLRILAHEAARGAGFSVALKITASAINLVMLTLLARAMAQEAFGTFAIWFNAASLLAVAAACGQEKLILRSWSEYGESGRPGLARGALAFGIRVAVGAPVATALFVVAYGLVAGTEPGLLAGAGLFVVLQSVFWFSSHATRAIAGIGWGEGHDITWRLVVVIGAGVALVQRLPIDAATFFLLADAGLLLAIALQVAVAVSRMPAAVRRATAEMETRAWFRRSFGMWSAAILEAAGQFLEVILVGLVLSPAAAGGYFVAVRLANAFAMITGGLYNYSTRQVSKLHYSNSGAELSEALRMMAWLTAALVTAGIVLVALAGRELLALFGPGFVESYPLLLILSFGTAAVALVGPAPAVLLLTGHEATYSRIVLASVVARCLGVVLLAPLFGAAGAALASAGGLLAMAIALGAACRRMAGIDPTPLVLFSVGRGRGGRP